jgi:hypothetical protein
MIVAELIRQLQSFPPDNVVILSQDEAGNGFLPVSNVESAFYITGLQPRCMSADELEDFMLLDETATQAVFIWGCREG